MNPESIKQTIQVIEEALRPLAEKLEKPATYIFELAVRQVYVDAAVNSISLFVCLLLLFTIPYWKFINQSELVAVILGVVLGLGLAITLISTVISVPQALFNPEWAAIEKLLSAVKAN